jgi:hypothetical protein
MHGTQCGPERTCWAAEIADFREVALEMRVANTPPYHLDEIVGGVSIAHHVAERQRRQADPLDQHDFPSTRRDREYRGLRRNANP